MPAIPRQAIHYGPNIPDCAIQLHLGGEVRLVFRSGLFVDNVSISPTLDTIETSDCPVIALCLVRNESIILPISDTPYLAVTSGRNIVINV
jgi:hypothetical protein